MQIGGLSIEPSPNAGYEAGRPTVAAGSPGEELQAVLDEDFQFQLRDNPEFASQAGFHQCDGQLQDLRPQAWEARLEHNAEVLERLRRLDLPSLDQTQKLRAQLLRAAIEDESRAIELGCHLAPINSIGIGGGVHWNFLEVLEWMHFKTEEDFKRYLDRLLAFPEQAQGYQDLLAYGAGMRGMPASESMLRRVSQDLRKMIDSDLPELHAPLKSKDVDPELAEQIRQAIDHCFRGSLQRLLDFLEDFYVERGRKLPGCKSLRNGAEVYAQCLRFHTSTAKTAQEIHDMGLAEVARIEGRFQKEVLDVLNFKGTFTEFADSLKNDSSFFYEAKEELLEGYRQLVARINSKLPDFFLQLPAIPLEVVEKEVGPAAYYFAGTPDGQRPGRFYVNTSRLPERAKYEMPTLALHEGVPGHHLQGALALENKELPDFLKYIEDRRYEIGPARRPLYTAYLEGWALYCEALGEEMGMYTTPHELFGRLSFEMMRAVRLVVDTGIHEFDWTVERAAAYMQEKTGMAANECSEECHRYAAWPGQACGYKVGQLAIEEMRRRAEAKLQQAFDLRSFHGLLLSAGPMPLDILSQRVDEWLAER
eukprot:TRINITY_DN51256_c0_g1_i1.p1 TRINITY_DN51256_c0_g1~~TRINITY_DN51256_c0_g1_i1.p1  ORF type:complete len:592 (-),score=146.33 TRINITY_DN51256_c0_g1_i1:59-1834(-)